MGKVKLNETLSQSILSSIPKEFSNLEKAMFIYKQLCSKLQYSIDYLIDEDNVREKFVDVKNLENVDGERNRDVVCFTFNAILGELLYESGVCERLNFDYGSNNNRFSYIHESIYLTIDGKEYDVDATYGVLDNNDLTLSKYSDYKPKGWIPCNGTAEEKEMLEKAIETVYSDDLEHQKNVEKYISLKQKEGGYLSLPFEKRVNLFFEMVKDMPDYSVVSFNYLLKLKHLLFAKNEYKDGQKIDKMIDLQFVKDKETNTLKALLFVNPKGYTDDKGYENFDSLLIYEIDVKDKKITQTDMETLREKINNKKYVSRRGDELLKPFEMMKEGKLDLRPIIEGEPVYDGNQQLTNKILGYERKLLKENKIVPYEIDRGE